MQQKHLKVMCAKWKKSSPLLSIVETANHEGNPQEGKQNQELQELQVTDGIRREIDYVGKTIIVVSNRSSGDITKKVTSSLYIYKDCLRKI